MIFIETDRLILRNVEIRDADEIHDYRNHEACARFQRDQTKERRGIAELIRRRAHDVLSVDAPAMLAVALKETDRIIGEIIVMPNEGTISLGYTFSYKIHRCGYAYEALTALIDHLHTHFPEWDYICFTEAENIASRKLLEKLGYDDLGYLPAKTSQVYGKWLRQDTMDEVAAAVSASQHTRQQNTDH